MALKAKKAQGNGPERLRRFVAQNLESLEPDLRVLETALRLGRSTVDVVAVDDKQTLVLVAVAEVADVTMLISALDAYIWCLAFPDNIRRLYPEAAIVAARPPRIVFVASQVPPAFLELAERLSVVTPECHEMAVDGEPAIEDEPEPVGVAAAEPQTRANGQGAHGRAANGHTPLAQAAEALLAQAVHAVEPAHVEHAAVNLGIRRRVENQATPAAPVAPAPPVAVAAPATPAAPAAPAAPAPRVAAEPKAPAQRPGHEEARPVNHPALQALRFPKSGVSRQWQEFLDQLAASQ